MNYIIVFKIMKYLNCYIIQIVNYGDIRKLIIYNNLRYNFLKLYYIVLYDIQERRKGKIGGEERGRKEDEINWNGGKKRKKRENREIKKERRRKRM